MVTVKADFFHDSSLLGCFINSLKLIKEAGLGEEDVVNTSLDKIERYLLNKI